VFSDNFEPGVISSKVRMNSCESAEKILTTNDFEESQSLYINRIALKESSFGNYYIPWVRSIRVVRKSEEHWRLTFG